MLSVIMGYSEMMIEELSPEHPNRLALEEGFLGVDADATLTAVELPGNRPLQPEGATGCIGQERF